MSLISAEELLLTINSSANNSDVIVIDCRFALNDPELGKKQYLTNHLPHSYYLDLNKDLSSPVQIHGGRHPLPNLTDLGDTLSQMGVNFNETLVVCYDDSRLAFASRLWWLLRYMGHDKVKILDGGYSDWVHLGYPTTTELPQSGQGNFTPQPRTDWTVNIDQVKEIKDLEQVVLVDSRESDRYRGIIEPIDPIAGHIPGAVNYPYQEITDSNGIIKSLDFHISRWALLKDKEIIVYCGSGVTACVNLLSLSLAQITHAKLYPGSWSDWCSYNE